MNKAECICGEEAWRHCPKCLTKSYCSRECQDKDWEEHKKSCISFRKQDSETPGFSKLDDRTFEFTSAEGAKKALEELTKMLG